MQQPKASFIYFSLLHWLKSNKINFFGKWQCSGGALVLYSTGFWSLSIIVVFGSTLSLWHAKGSRTWLCVCTMQRKTINGPHITIILLGQVGDSRRIGPVFSNYNELNSSLPKKKKNYMKNLQISPFLIIASQFLYLEFLMVMFD